MKNFKKRKRISYLPHIIILVSFLWPNAALASGLSAECLAPISNLHEVMNDLIPYGVIQTLESAELPDFKVFYDREVEARITDNAEEVRCFGVRDGAKWAFYRVDLISREITRFVSSKGVSDKFFSVLNMIEPLQCTKVDTFANYRKEIYKLTDKLLPYVVKCVGRLPKATSRTTKTFGGEGGAKRGAGSDYRKRSAFFGGKGVGLSDLALIKDRIQEITGVEVEIPNFQTLSIPEGWNAILRHNADLVREGDFINSHREEVVRAVTEGRIAEYEELVRLQEYVRTHKPLENINAYLDVYMELLADSVKLPKLLHEIIIKKMEKLGDVITVRSSGANEDQFEQSMAGVYPSFGPVGKSEVEANVERIYKVIIKKIWSEERKDLEGNGFAVILQDFIEADKGGVAVTNGTGQVSIEAVVGRVSTAVKQEKPNATIYDCSVHNGKVDFNIIRGFSKYPYEIETGEGKFNRKDNLEKIRELWVRGTNEVNGIRSPMTKDEIEKAALVIKTIEDLLGYPVDIEFAVKGGKVILLQKRPRVDVEVDEAAIKPLSGKVDKNTITISAGKPYRTPKPIHVVVFNRRDNITSEAIGWLKSNFGEDGYVKVQADVVSEEYHVHSDEISGQRILVDPDSGTRIAHNMQLFRDKAGNNFVYLAGPGLKQFLRGLTYYEPEYGNGILVSKELVMVESNGDDNYGGMYIAGMEESDDPEPMFVTAFKELVNESDKEGAGVIDYQRKCDEIFDKLSFKEAYEQIEETLQLFRDMVISAVMSKMSENKLIQKQILEYLTEYYLEKGPDGIEFLENLLRGISYELGFRSLWPASEDNFTVEIMGILSTIHEFCGWFKDKTALVEKSLQILSDKRKEALVKSSKKGAVPFSPPFSPIQKSWPVKIVFIDDDTARCRTYKRRMLKEYAGRFDVKVSIFSDRNEALAYVQKERPQVIFVDYVLAGEVNGVDLIEEVRRIQGYDPVIYMEPGGMEGDAGRIGSLGITWCYINRMVTTVEGFLLDYRDKLPEQERNRILKSLYERAFNEFSTGLLEKSVLVFEYILKLFPDEDKAKIELASIYFKLGKYEKAKTYIDFIDQGAQDIDKQWVQKLKADISKALTTLDKKEELEKKGYRIMIVPDGKGGYRLDTIGFSGKWAFTDLSNGEDIYTGFILRLLKSLAVTMEANSLSVRIEDMVNEVVVLSNDKFKDKGVLFQQREGGGYKIFVSSDVLMCNPQEQRELFVRKFGDRANHIDIKDTILAAALSYTMPRIDKNKKIASIALDNSLEEGRNLLCDLLGREGFNVEKIDMGEDNDALLQRLDSRQDEFIQIMTGYKDSARHTAEKLMDSSIQILCISVNNQTIEKACILIKEIKAKRPDIFIIIGGPLSSLPEQMLSLLSNADCLITGEADRALPNLLNYLTTCNVDQRAVLNIEDFFSVSSGGIYLRNGVLCTVFVNNLHKSDMPSEIHTVLPTDDKKSETVFTSRGCPFKCAFCNLVFGRKFREVKNEEVIDWLIHKLALRMSNITSSKMEYSDIKKMLENGENLYEHGLYAPIKIEVWDDNFFTDRKRVIDLCGKIMDLGLNKYFVFSVEGASLRSILRQGVIDREMLSATFNAGFTMLSFGIDGLSNRNLSDFKKGYSQKEIIKILFELYDLGFLIDIKSILSSPRTFYSDMLESMLLCYLLPAQSAEYTNPGILGDLTNELTAYETISHADEIRWIRNRTEFGYYDEGNYIVPQAEEYAYRRYNLLAIADKTTEKIAKAFFRGQFSPIKHIGGAEAGNALPLILKRWLSGDNGSELQALGRIFLKLLGIYNGDLHKVYSKINKDIYEFYCRDFIHLEELYEKYGYENELDLRTVYSIDELDLLIKEAVKKKELGKISKFARIAMQIALHNYEYYYLVIALDCWRGFYDDIGDVVKELSKNSGVDIPIFYKDNIDRLKDRLKVYFAQRINGSTPEFQFEQNSQVPQDAWEKFMVDMETIADNVSEALKFIKGEKAEPDYKLLSDKTAAVPINKPVEANLDIKAARDTKRLLDDGLELLNYFSEAGKLADAVKETEGQAVRVIRTFGDPRIIGKCSDSARKLIGLIVRYEKWDLPKEADVSGERYVIYNPKRMPENLRKLTFEMKRNYNVAFVDQKSKVPEGADAVVLVDPEDISEWKGTKMNYLPLPYMEQSIKIAAIMALNEGKMEKRSQAYYFVKNFYEILLGHELSEDEVSSLFKMPWEILREVERLKGDLDILHEAVKSLDRNA